MVLAAEEELDVAVQRVRCVVVAEVAARVDIRVSSSLLLYSVRRTLSPCH